MPLIVVLMALVAGCAATTVADGSSQANFITLKDTSPGKLDARVMVTLGAYDTSTRDTTTVDVRFLVGNRLVRMTGDERLVCNNASLQRYAGSFELQAATSTLAGKEMTCTYTSGASAGTIAFTMPAAPIILAPHDGSSVTRSTQTIVRYRVADGITPAVVATGVNNKAIASPGATNASQATLNTSAFAAGSGQIVLTQATATIAAQNTGFKTLMVQTSAITTIAVLWA
jgi:hypothetical protein